MLAALDEARATKGQPTMIVAGTMKGKGVSLAAGRKAGTARRSRRAPEADQALKELESQYVKTSDPAPVIPKPAQRRTEGPLPNFAAAMPAPAYKLGDRWRRAKRSARRSSRSARSIARVVVLDADVKNSTFTEAFEHAYPDRFYENFIAEQVMIGAAMGLASRGAIAFPTTFACFLERAADFIRMTGISDLNVKLAGTHVGVSIGEDGPVADGARGSRDDARGAERARALSVRRRRDAPAVGACGRSSRPRVPAPRPSEESGHLRLDETFTVGGSKTLRQSANGRGHRRRGRRDALRGAEGATTRWPRAALRIRVIDAYSMQPIDKDGLVAAARATSGRVLTVEDHYAAGGLGDAVSEALSDEGARVHRLAVRVIPHSGHPDELLDHYGLSARAIVEAVMAFVR